VLSSLVQPTLTNVPTKEEQRKSIHRSINDRRGNICIKQADISEYRIKSDGEGSSEEKKVRKFSFFSVLNYKISLKIIVSPDYGLILAV